MKRRTIYPCAHIQAATITTLLRQGKTRLRTTPGAESNQKLIRANLAPTKNSKLLILIRARGEKKKEAIVTRPAGSVVMLRQSRSRLYITFVNRDSADIAVKF